jgi:hypothetical protein
VKGARGVQVVGRPASLRPAGLGFSPLCIVFGVDIPDGGYGCMLAVSLVARPASLLMAVMVAC